MLADGEGVARRGLAAHEREADGPQPGGLDDAPQAPHGALAQSQLLAARDRGWVGGVGGH